MNKPTNRQPATLKEPHEFNDAYQDGTCAVCGIERYFHNEAPPQAQDAVEQIPMVNGLDCPACGHPTLILGNGGFITCSLEDCPNPDFAEALTSARLDSAIELAQRFKDMMLCTMCGDRKPNEPCICSAHQACSPEGIDALIAQLQAERNKLKEEGSDAI